MDSSPVWKTPLSKDNNNLEIKDQILHQLLKIMCIDLPRLTLACDQGAISTVSFTKHCGVILLPVFNTIGSNRKLSFKLQTQIKFQNFEFKSNYNISNAR